MTVAAGAAEARDLGATTTAVVADLREHQATLFGVATGGGRDATSGVAAVAGKAGKAPGLVNVYRSFADPFAAAPVPQIASTGALPMVTWEPWDPAGGTHQPKFALRLVAGGRYDAYARAWALAARAYGRPLLLRFAPEMNGDWTPWSAGVNGNSASDYVRAWRHLHDLFRNVGASNVSWVWSPNVVFRGSTPLTSLYPGDAYVDWIGIDGYNWGTSRRGRSWVGFDRLFGPTLQQVRRLARKPLMLSEVASTERGGDKAVWISDFFRALDRNRDVLAFVWFDFDKETDWRISSSASARSAFARGVAAPRYRGAAVAG
jgi:beta-mannanase